MCKERGVCYGSLVRHDGCTPLGDVAISLVLAAATNSLYGQSHEPMSQDFAAATKRQLACVRTEVAPTGKATHFLSAWDSLAAYRSPESLLLPFAFGSFLLTRGCGVS